MDRQRPPVQHARGHLGAVLRAERVLPYLREAADRQAIAAGDSQTIETAVARIDDLGGPAEPPARIHGDLWSGNVHWAADGRAWLVDPAAHGGHRETDLAMLALFGAPHLDRILAAYDEADPLADGWQHRVALHQLHPLLVHAVLFGGGYGRRPAPAPAGPCQPASACSSGLRSDAQATGRKAGNRTGSRSARSHSPGPTPMSSRP